MSEHTHSVAWGDWDNDGDLDLAVGNAGEPNRVYANEGDSFTLAWSASLIDTTRSVAWGDWDGDSDLDLAIGNSHQPNRVYANHGGQLTLAWSASITDSTYSVAWGDWDHDGDLDLAVGNIVYEDLGSSISPSGAPNRVYSNTGGQLTLAWSSLEIEPTTSVAWSDWDNDGDLDLAVGNDRRPNQVYANQAGDLVLAWSAAEWDDSTTNIAWGDWNNDGALELAVGNRYKPVRIYSNYSAHNAGLVDTANRLQIEYPGNNAVVDSPSATVLTGPTLPIHYQIFDRENQPARWVKAYFSLDGGSRWQPAIAATGTITRNLAASPTGAAHTFLWDIYANRIFGNLANVVFRLDAYQGFTGAGPYQYIYRTAKTLPFRLRGSQVRVLNQGEPGSGALVYRQAIAHSGPYKPYHDNTGQPFYTNVAGYLPGRGELAQGDQLVALLPITHTANYTLYHTSAAPSDVGVEAYPVTALGVQTLTVSAHNPLLLFNLDVALEWDARQDATFLAQLQFDLQRAAELLYDWSNGQATLGAVRLYHDAKRYPEVGDWQPWLSAHVRILASNRLRPSAAQGGLVASTVNDPTSEHVTYIPGQVYMGAVWNRYGEANGSLGEDWPRTLAHELSHYLFYLDDNYLGLTDEQILTPVESCPGAMADPYRDDYSEYHPDADWLARCAQTLSQRETGRSDWATIRTFYPILQPPAAFNSQPGPSGLPLAVTTIHELAPPQPSNTLAAPIFYVAQAGRSVQPGAQARAFLLQEDWLIDLGTTAAGQIQARGARPGDRLCLFDLGEQRLGCDRLDPGDSQLLLTTLADWQPEVLVTPVSSTTVNISVGNVPAGLTLQAHLYPASAPATGVIPLALADNRYNGSFALTEPALEGYVQVWVEEAEPRREVIAEYTVGGNPGRIMSRGTRIMSRGGRIMSRGTRIMSRGAPIISGDGQVLLFADDLTFDVNQEWFYTIQPATRLPNPPAWATGVGRGYWLTASANAPNLRRTSLGFNYLGSDVPPGEEAYLRIYFWNGAVWQPLPTTLSQHNNFAAAQSQGPGLYALFTSIPVALQNAGWNVFAYPAQTARPVADALLAISGTYTTVYGYVATDGLDPWKIYDVGMPAWANDLRTLEYNQVYWINARQAVTIEFKGVEAATQPESVLPYPPATFYGVLQPSASYTPTAGVAVIAWINGQRCGQGLTQAVNGQIVYGVDVWASDFALHAHCGVPGAIVTFQVGAEVMPVTAHWDNSRSTQLSLLPTGPGGIGGLQARLYLPLVVR